MTQLWDTAGFGLAAENLLFWLLHAVVYGTILAVLTAALLGMGRGRVRPVVNGALWLIVLLKFLVPLGPSWSYSLASAIQQTTGWVHSGSDGGSASNDASVPQVIWLAPPPSGERLAGEVTGQLPPRWSAAAVLCGLYLTGLGAVFAARIAAYRRFTSACRALPLAAPATVAVVADICRRLSVHRVPLTRLSDDAPAPFIYGLRRPTLVLSKTHLVRPDELEAVVLHEIAHLRRGDLLVRYVQWLAGTVLFFWPVVAWVNRRLDLVREHACDEWALRHGRLSAGQYARCLLVAVHPVQSRRWAYHPAAMGARRGTIERRIDMLLNSCGAKRSFGFFGAGSVLLAAWATFVLSGASFADPPASGKSDDESNEPHHIVIFQSADAEATAAMEDGDDDGAAEGLHSIELKAVASDGKVMFITKQDSISRKRIVSNFSCPLHFAEQDLASFFQKYPQADIDGSGDITPSEHDAYLVAVAMKDPQAVVAQFPSADRDGDGRLADVEAARLLAIGAAPNFAAHHFAARDRGMAGAAMFITRGSAPHAIGGAIAESKDPGAWVLENIAATPSASEAARYLDVVEQTPLRVFLEIHPEADADGDGALTVEERDSFLQDLVKLHFGKSESDTADGRKVFIIGEIGDEQGPGILMEAGPGETITTQARRVHLNSGTREFEITIDAEVVGEDDDNVVIEKKVWVQQTEGEPEQM